MEITEGHTGLVGGRDAAQFCAGPFLQEVSHQLAGSVIIGASGLEGCFLDLPLPVHTAQCGFVREVGRVQGDQQGGIGIFAVPGYVAHAVGAEAAFLGCRRYHMTAGTHAEGISGISVRQFYVELVIGGGQIGGPGKAAVLALVDHGLPVLNAYAHGERLGLHGNSLLQQGSKRVSGTVADGQNGLRTGQVDFVAVLVIPQTC